MFPKYWTLYLLLSLFRAWSRCPDRECNKSYFAVNSCEMAGKHQIYFNKPISMLVQRLSPSRYWGVRIFPSPSPLPPSDTSILSDPKTHKWRLCTSPKNLCNPCIFCVNTAIVVHSICSRLGVSKGKKVKAWDNCLHQSRKCIIFRS